jgi:UDP-N-acetyl-D-mannosaminuronate dehydrogenase
LWNSPAKSTAPCPNASWPAWRRRSPKRGGASVAAALRGRRILVLGLAYKANVDDDRESPSYRLLDLLQARGATVAYHDPYLPVIRPTREHSHWAGTKSVKWNRKTISRFDAVLIATAHAAVDYRQLAGLGAAHRGHAQRDGRNQNGRGQSLEGLKFTGRPAGGVAGATWGYSSLKLFRFS